MYLYVLISIGIIWETGDGVDKTKNKNYLITTTTTTAQNSFKNTIASCTVTENTKKNIYTIYQIKIKKIYQKSTATCMPEATI